MVRKRNDELVSNYIKIFKDMKSRCYSLSLSDSQLAELAFQQLLPHIKKRFSSQEFESISHLDPDRLTLSALLRRDVGRRIAARPASDGRKRKWDARLKQTHDAAQINALGSAH